MYSFLNEMGPALHNFYDQKQLQDHHMERFSDLMSRVGYDLRTRKSAPNPPDSRQWENFVSSVRSECRSMMQGGGWGNNGDRNNGGHNNGRGGGYANDDSRNGGRRFDDRPRNGGRRFDDGNGDRRFNDGNRRYDRGNNGRYNDNNNNRKRERERGRFNSGRGGRGRQFKATDEEIRQNVDSTVKLMRTAFGLSWKDSAHQTQIVQYRVDINIWDSASESYILDEQIREHTGLRKKLFHMAMEKVKERKGEGCMESSMRIVDTMSFMSKMDPKAMHDVSDLILRPYKQLS